MTINRAYPDAANAVLVRSRVPTNPTRRIIELGAAIEQYVRTNFAEARARGRARTSWTRRQQPDAAALALNAGAEFVRFVGDPARWGELFHEAYMSEKHYIGGMRHRAADLTTLASSAQLLLISVLLNRAAHSHNPSRVVLTDYRVAQLGQHLRPLVAAWAPTPKRQRR